MWLNTKELKENLTGKNRGFITRVSHQQEKYGNTNVFEAGVYGDGVNISIGDWNIHFFFSANGKIINKNGIGVGSKYAAQLENCAVELFHKLIMKGGN